MMEGKPLSFADPRLKKQCFKREKKAGAEEKRKKGQKKGSQSSGSGPNTKKLKKIRTKQNFPGKWKEVGVDTNISQKTAGT